MNVRNDLTSINLNNIKTFINIKANAPLFIISSLIPYLLSRISIFQFKYQFKIFSYNISFEYAHPLAVLVSLLLVFLCSFFQIGYALSALKNNDKNTTLINFLSGIQWKKLNSFLVKVGLMYLLIIGGLFLAIIPGILVAFCLAFVPYIAIDNEQINIKNTYALSYQLMKKHYKDYIALLISFIPHDVFSALSFRLYDLYLVPLKNLSYSKLYIDLYFNQVEE